MALLDASMGAVRIRPTQGLERHRGPDLLATPDGWEPLAAEYYFGRVRRRLSGNSLAAVAASRSWTFAALIVVHMTPDWRGAAVGRQAGVVRGAVSRRYRVCVVQRQEAHVTGNAAIRATLPQPIADVLNGYPDLEFYAGLSGNALTATRPAGHNGAARTLGSTLRAGSDVIVVGQSLGQCIDSTILGRMPNQQLTPGAPYEPGLLDLGISVTTSRRALLPCEENPSPYFDLNMTGVRAPPAPAAAANAEPAAATNAALAAATDAALAAPTEP